MSRTYRHQQIQDVYDAQRSAPTPIQVEESRRRIEQGNRLPDTRGPRKWYCRSCGHAQQAQVIPAGWYSVTRHTGSIEDKPARLGVYCSAECLDAQMPRLIGVEADAGDTWRDSPYRQKPTERGAA